MRPTTGRIVHYRLSEQDAEQINRRRDHAKRFAEDNTHMTPGWQRHIGNRVNAGEVVPMTIVVVWQGHLVNGQASLDGNDCLWVTSASEGHGNGQWTWPPRESEEGR